MKTDVIYLTQSKGWPTLCNIHNNYWVRIHNWIDLFTWRATGPTARVLPGLDDVTAQADLLCFSVQLQTQVDLPLDLLIWVHSGQVYPAVQPWDTSQHMQTL